MQELRIIPVSLSAEIRPKDSLAGKLLDGLRGKRLSLLKGDIVVVKHKVVSKAEGRLVLLDTVKTTTASRAWGKRYHVDARVIELALRESVGVIRRKKGVLITETRHGFICANSGIDVSNVDGGEHALLLPEDPDRSARKLHRELRKLTGHSIPVIISDSFGRAWREGLTEAAIGVAGMHALHDYRGRRDPHGYPLRVTIDAVADELACAAGLLSSKLTRTPFVIIRGFPYRPGRGNSRSLLRPAEQDLFR
ncbi:MAG TPA: coenzyme F420-0:L-glutamate ligase [Terriglobales bacterium]|jgi:coenzyme F420-0:L-glutamate ligase / coenzyme F420-1:gamma-L-glutamate ligase|nr:coenzyme F420-0:L-glutamate ligase [Terriglobales bacterium]